MKKLTLNKQTIAQLDEPTKIYGGVPLSYDAGTKHLYSVCPSICPCPTTGGGLHTVNYCGVQK
jgi:hypothetical protein